MNKIKVQYSKKRIEQIEKLLFRLRKRVWDCEKACGLIDKIKTYPKLVSYWYARQIGRNNSSLERQGY